MPSPNIIASVLARETKGVAVVLLGDSIALYNPPIRVAEEIAMLDCMSGGRLVAGFPVGTSMDTNYCYGENPTTLREKYREAEDLITQAWMRPEPFAFNGKYTKLRYVNVWPRPVQKPRPPIWIPGGGSVETWDWVCEKDHMYAALSYSGYKRQQKTFDEFWPVVDKYDLPRNPYRAGIIHFVAIADSEAQAEELYAPHLEWFYNKTQHIYGGFIDAPGYRSMNTIAQGFTTEYTDVRITDRKWEHLVSEGVVAHGTPDQVAEQIEYIANQFASRASGVE
jgi:alkanesulfonate monooxygenase SsuD/methylene tetrahydromethanopterin reductase-like flavin-dependent oxidoreductase (luciferase family)